MAVSNAQGDGRQTRGASETGGGAKTKGAGAAWGPPRRTAQGGMGWASPGEDMLMEEILHHLGWLKSYK